MFVCIYLLNIIIMPFVAAAAANSSTWQGLNGLENKQLCAFLWAWQQLKGCAAVFGLLLLIRKL